MSENWAADARVGVPMFQVIAKQVSEHKHRPRAVRQIIDQQWMDEESKQQLREIYHVTDADLLRHEREEAMEVRRRTRARYGVPAPTGPCRCDTEPVVHPSGRIECGSCGAEWAKPEVRRVIVVQWLDEASKQQMRESFHVTDADLSALGRSGSLGDRPASQVNGAVVAPGDRPGSLVDRSSSPDAHPRDDVVPAAPGDQPAVTNALRAMFTRDFVYLGMSALQIVLTAVMTPILTRRLGVGPYGQLALAVVIAQLLGVTFSLGLPFAAQRVFAGEDGDRQSRGVLAISAVLAVTASLIAGLAAPLWGPAVGLDLVLDARLAALWAACFGLTLTSLAMLRSREKLRTAIFVAAVQSVGAQAIGLSLLFWRAPTVTAYLSGLVIGQGTAALILSLIHI